MPKPTTPRGKDTRHRIVEATLEVIANDGVRAVTHRKVAAQSGASMGLITYYFASTEALIAATLEALTQTETQRLRELHDAIRTAGWTVEAVVDALVGELRLRSTTRRRDAIAGITLTLEIPRHRVAREAFDEWETTQTELYRSIAEAFGASDPEPLAEYLLATMEGLSYFAAITSDPDGLAESGRVGLTQILASLPAAPMAAGRGRR